MRKKSFAPLNSCNSLTAQLKISDKAKRQKIGSLARLALASPRNDMLPRLQIDLMPVDRLVQPGRNVRKIEAVHVQEVANTISTLGFCDPILIGKDNVVIDGVIRVEAARQVGLREVPCIFIEHLSKTELRTLRLALNRLGEKGGWELDQLKVEFEELIVLDASIEATGFEEPEIDQILIGEEITGIERGPLVPDPSATAIASLGDIFQLGPHTIICGDATDPTVLAKLMANTTTAARLVLTDPPYNVPIRGNVTGGAHREFAMASGEMSDTDFQQFNFDWMAAILPYVIDGGLVAPFIDWRGYPLMYAAAAQNSLEALNLIVWTKTNAGMGSLYRSRHELLPFFKFGKASHTNHIQLGRKGRWRSNVWTYPGASSLGSDARRGLAEHPTVKPTQMLMDALLDVSGRGDVILDPFLGSGSTLISAEKTGRICCGVEIDPLYVDVIIRRFEAETGQKAALVDR